MKKNSFRNILQTGEELIFPRRCPVCDEAVRIGDYLICMQCRTKLKLLGGLLCMKCGKPLNEKEEEYCFDCMKIKMSKDKEHFFIKGAALFEYNSVSAAIHRFKYGGRQEYAEFFGVAMAKYLGKEILTWHPDALIPVPIHSSKMRQRGYNQAQLLARVLGREINCPVRNDIVIRTRKTVPQKDLNDEERQNNLKKAFKLSGNDVKLNTIVIIDDIYTTGSTIDAMGYEFRRIGITQIYYVALAIGRGL